MLIADHILILVAKHKLNQSDSKAATHNFRGESEIIGGTPPKSFRKKKNPGALKGEGTRLTESS